MTKPDQFPTWSRSRTAAWSSRAAGSPPRRGLKTLRLAPLTSLLVLTLAAGPAAAGTKSAGDTSDLGARRSAPVQLTLPEPTGPHRIGTVSFHLVDRSRRDPWKPDKQARELMIQLWYPAQKVAGHPRAPWLSPGVAKIALGGVPAGAVQLPVTHGHVGAPVQRGKKPRPVVLFSHGLGADRASSTALVEDLASHGYVVATIDHTYDAAAVEFPDGRVETHAMPPPASDAPDDPVFTKAAAVRQTDTRFVMDRLTALTDGRGIDAERRPPPKGLRGALDLSRIGMSGHSLGGATAAATMQADRRIKAGIDMDGALFGPVLRAGLDRPFLLIGTPEHSRDNDPGWKAVWSRLRGWKLELRLDGAAHGSFTDLQVLLRQHSLGMPPERVTEIIGRIDGPRSVLIQRVFTRAFFDRHLRGRPSPLLDGPSKRWPEMRFAP